MSRLMRRYLLLPSLLLGLMPLVHGSGHAQATDYPTKPLTMVVPFPAGGRTDVVGRIVAQELAQQVGKHFAVVNKPGVSVVSGAREVAEAASDGYTIGFFGSAAVTSQYTVPNPILLSEFKLVAIVNADPAALAVQQAAPWRSLKELVEDARKQPDKLRMGIIPGASAQVFAGGFENAASLRFIMVPFKGDSDGAAALAAGDIDLHLAVPVSYKSLLAANKVRILAVADSAPSALYGNTPTFRDNGVDLVIDSFSGVFVPRSTPQSVIDKLADAISQAMKSQQVEANMSNVGARILFLRGTQAADFLATQDAIYHSAINELGLNERAVK